MSDTQVNVGNEATERGLSDFVNGFLKKESFNVAKVVVDGIIAYVTGKGESVVVPVTLLGHELEITISGKVKG